jgi:hypothetical protein
VKYYGEGYFLDTVNNTLASLASRPGVGLIVSCLERTDRVHAWEYTEDVCADACSCGSAGVAYGCLNTGGCCSAVRQLLLLYTNVLGVICIVRFAQLGRLSTRTRAHAPLPAVPNQDAALARSRVATLSAALIQLRCPVQSAFLDADGIVERARGCVTPRRSQR